MGLRGRVAFLILSPITTKHMNNKRTLFLKGHNITPQGLHIPVYTTVKPDKEVEPLDKHGNPLPESAPGLPGSRKKEK